MATLCVISAGFSFDTASTDGISQGSLLYIEVMVNGLCSWNKRLCNFNQYTFSFKQKRFKNVNKRMTIIIIIFYMFGSGWVHGWMGVMAFPIMLVVMRPDSAAGTLHVLKYAVRTTYDNVPSLQGFTLLDRFRRISSPSSWRANIMGVETFFLGSRLGPCASYPGGRSMTDLTVRAGTRSCQDTGWRLAAVTASVPSASCGSFLQAAAVSTGVYRRETGNSTAVLHVPGPVAQWWRSSRCYMA